ncbi:MAG: PorV/PorQ family protein [bacterium]
MMHRLSKLPLAIFALILFLNGNARAQLSGLTKTGLTAATFLSIEVGPRAKAMGGAFVGLADDISALYWNPAGIADLSNNALMFSHTEWIADVNFDFAGVAFQVGNFGTLGAFITSLSMPDLQVRTVSQPEGTGEFFGANDIALGVSYARFLTDRFSIGANFKFIRESIFNSSASTVAVDFGTLFRTSLNDMVIGFSISNFGGDMQLSGIDTQVEVDISPNEFGNNDRIFANLETEDFQLPLTFRVGVAMKVLRSENNVATVAVDGIVPSDNDQYLNVGGEYVFNNFFALRAGYRTLFLSDSEEGLTLGAGVKQKLFGETTFQFDYAYGDFGLLDNVQEFSISIYF